MIVQGGNGNDFISAAPVNMLADTFGRIQVGVTIDGGAGNDTIIGGNSNAAAFIQDVIDQHEEDGNAAAAEAVRGLFDLDTIDIDVLRGGDGDDTIIGLGGVNHMDGGAGDDTLLGGLGRDTIYGGEGNDEIIGKAGNDLVISGLGDDFIQGNRGDDTFHYIGGNDTFIGGMGNDTLKFDFDGTFNLSLSSHREQAIGSYEVNVKGVENVQGNDEFNKLFGNSDDNTIFATKGNDIYAGGTGIDTIDFSNFNDLTGNFRSGKFENRRHYDPCFCF